MSKLGEVDGLRLIVFKAYEPVTVRQWVEFVKDCELKTVSTLRLVRIFDACKANARHHRGKRKEKQDEEEEEASLSYDEFGAAVHKLAAMAYHGASCSCSKFCYLHLQTLECLRQRRWLVSVHERRVVAWKGSKEISVGLKELFVKHARQVVTTAEFTACKMSLSDWQRFLRSVDLFPAHVSLVALQDAFFETLIDCSWEDERCNRRLKGDLFDLALSLPAFLEALCRILIKSNYFRRSFSSKDLVRLLDQFFFPRRHLRLHKDKTRSGARDRHPLSLKSFQSGLSSSFSSFSSSSSSSLSSLSSSSSWSQEDHRAYFGDEYDSGLVDTSNAEQEQNLRRRTNRRIVSPTNQNRRNKDARFDDFFEMCVDPSSRKVARASLLRFIKESKNRGALATQRKLEQACLRVEKSIEKNRAACQQRAESRGGQGGSNGPAPSGFVSIEEHQILLAKLEALQDALDMGGMGELEWDGTLGDAEKKMQELIPLMMSEDPKEQMEASDKFEAYDKIVRNHKDYKIREEQRKEQWRSDNAEANRKALCELQELFPKCIAQGTALRDLTDIFNLAPRLAKRVFQRKALRLIHMDPQEIARCHIADLTSQFSTQGLDLRELRAIFANLPDEFVSDGDGRKDAWKDAVLSQLQDKVKAAESGKLPQRQLIDPAYTNDPVVSPPTTAPSSKGLLKFKLAIDPKISDIRSSLAGALKRRMSTSVLVHSPVEEGPLDSPKIEDGNKDTTQEQQQQQQQQEEEEKETERKQSDSGKQQLQHLEEKHNQSQPNEKVARSPGSAPTTPTSPLSPPTPFTEERRVALSKQSLISSIVQQLKEEGSSTFSSECTPSEEDSSSLASSGTTESSFMTGGAGPYAPRESKLVDIVEGVESEDNMARIRRLESQFANSRQVSSPKTSHLADLKSRQINVLRSPCTPRSAVFSFTKSPSSAISEVKSPALIGELSAVLQIRRDSTSKKR